MAKDYNNDTIVYDIAIIGAGPAGLSAAISAGKIIKNNSKKKKIAIFESENKIGKSILKTGNGRCNFSNYYIQENGGEFYFNDNFCDQVFNSCINKVQNNKLFDCNDESLTMSPVYQMFEEIGLSCYVDEDGKMFPYTNKASTVVDVLKYKVKELPISIYTEFKLIKILKDKDKKCFELRFDNGEIINANKIIFSTGSIKNIESILSDSKLSKDYKNFIKVLGPIKTENKFTKHLDGIKVHVKCSILNNNKEQWSEIGELLFRNYGVSGICVFNLSRFVEADNKGSNSQTIRIDFAPEDEFSDLYDIVKNRYDKLEGKVTAERLFAGMILPEIIKGICKLASINHGDIKKQDLKIICKKLKAIDLKVLGIGDEKQCQVSRGGIKVNAINPQTLESNSEKNFFLAGEIIDVDGPCGGYNLHWAWSSGILAGISATD